MAETYEKLPCGEGEVQCYKITSTISVPDKVSVRTRSIADIDAELAALETRKAELQTLKTTLAALK